MREPENNDTLIWYRENAAEFADRTANVDMSALYRAFLAYMPSGGRIMADASNPSPRTVK